MRGVAAQTIMVITRVSWGEHEQRYATWYAPPEDQADIDLAVHRVLRRAGLFLNTVGDIALLPRVLDAASRFQTSVILLTTGNPHSQTGTLRIDINFLSST